MKVIVTGAAGFVGRALTAELLRLRHTVTAVDLDVDGLPDGVCRVAGDLSDGAVRQAAMQTGFDAIVHLATLPGGAAEADPALSRRINLDATYDLIVEAAERAPGVRFVFASSIAVFGAPPSEGVDDATPLSPRLIYGGHKAMMEQAVALFSTRNMIDGVSLRLPGIVARPRGSQAMKSAFMSDVFHALREDLPFVCPVSAGARVWVQSVRACVTNLIHALGMDTSHLPLNRAITLPACHFALGDLVGEIARKCGVLAERVRYEADPALETAFAAMPPLRADRAVALGFRADAGLPVLVGAVLRHIAAEGGATQASVARQ